MTAPGGRKIIGLGLSRENITRLQANQPIQFDLESLPGFGAADVLIFAGETEATMHKDFQALIGPHTVVDIQHGGKG